MTQTPIDSDKNRHSGYNSAITIAPLLYADVEIVVDMAKRMHAESPVYRDYPFSEVIMRSWVVAAIEKPNSCFCAVAWKNGEIIGAFLGLAGHMLFSECRRADELGFYVYEQFRGGRAALLLVKAFEEWAKRVGCVLVMTGVSAGITDERAISFYERLQYKKHGATFRREIG